MSRLLETIKCLDGACLHLDYHLKRLNSSRKTLGFDHPLKLQLAPPNTGLYRCRIVYEKEIESIEYLPYTLRLPRSFKLLHSDLSYDLKYENRDEINALFEQRQETEEIIIIKNSLITDTSIANLCFFDGKNWLTPSKPLLKGTTRQRLLDAKKIKEANLSYTDIHKFSQIAVMNAMSDFQIIENAIIS